MAVALDVQGMQSVAHADRGIARYLVSLATALLQLPSAHLGSLVVNPDLPMPGTLEPLLSLGRIEVGVHDSAPAVYHVGSPFELGVPLERILPLEARRPGVRTAVTLYDLIPLRIPDVYLNKPGDRARYHARLRLVETADRVLAISRATAQDAVEMLGLTPERVVTVGTGVSGAFLPAARRQAALEATITAVPGLRPGFALYTGGIDWRKNVDRLLEAYAGVAPELRARHQLVIVCAVHPAWIASTTERAARLGVGEDVLFTGLVPETALLGLYQSCRLFVFPSLREGFGMPVAEALACAAPVVCSDTPSLAELVPQPERRFDPESVPAIRGALEHALRDGLQPDAEARRRLDTWRDVARRVDGVYGELCSRPSRRRRRPRVAYVSPLPPQPTGVADYSARLATALASRCDLDVFTHPTSPAVAPDGAAAVHDTRSLGLVEHAGGGYDAVVYALGNSPHHAETLQALKRRRGALIAHDVRVANLLHWCRLNRPDIAPEPLESQCRRLYGPSHAGLLDGDELPGLETLDRLGIYLARETLAASTRVFVHSQYAASLARLEAGDTSVPVTVLPFGHPPVVERARDLDGPPLVVTFGVVHRAKSIDRIVEALPVIRESFPRARLAVVGPIGDEERAWLDGVASGLGLRDAVEITGRVSPAELDEWLDRASVAVQLRALSSGESSASIADCLAGGVPTIVTALGATRELPDTCVRKVGRDVSAVRLGLVVAGLLADRDLRASLSEAGRAYAAARTFEAVADRLLEVVLPRAWEPGRAFETAGAHPAFDGGRVSLTPSAQ